MANVDLMKHESQETRDEATTSLSSSERRLIERFSGSAPRYTSYPTAPHFSRAVDLETHTRWLQRLASEQARDQPTGDDRVTSALSLYLHIPFCSTLCWFCACRSQGISNPAPVERYLDFLALEIDKTAQLVDGARVRQIHWGGGSPTILSPEAIVRLAARVRSRFDVVEDAEFAVEIDPRDMSESRMDALAEAGLTRASLGVQDFDPEVQAAINRKQSFEDTRFIVEGMRARGVANINLDALYGLPHQSLDRFERTIEQLLALKPDRVALFGYAHVPWMSPRQRLIAEESLPNSEERFVQARQAAQALTDAGYVRIGLDHFARPDDQLAIAASKGTLRRNFQGYTADDCSALLGLGASAISRTPYGYAQNVSATAAYQTKIEEDGLATSRGVAFSVDDKIRAAAIEQVMCDLRLDAVDLTTRFGDLAGPVKAIARGASKSLPDGLITPDDNGGFQITELGRPFLRNIASLFDAYVDEDAARYSRAV